MVGREEGMITVNPIERMLIEDLAVVLEKYRKKKNILDFNNNGFSVARFDKDGFTLSFDKKHEFEEIIIDYIISNNCSLKKS